MSEFDIPELPLQHILSEPFHSETADEVCQVLETHSINVQKSLPLWKLIMPGGTIHSEIWPRTNNMRYKVTLPDTFFFYLIVERSGRNIIKLPLSAFSEEFQNKYGYNDAKKST